MFVKRLQHRLRIYEGPRATNDDLEIMGENDPKRNDGSSNDDPIPQSRDDRGYMRWEQHIKHPKSMLEVMIENIVGMDGMSGMVGMMKVEAIMMTKTIMIRRGTIVIETTMIEGYTLMIRSDSHKRWALQISREKCIWMTF